MHDRTLERTGDRVALTAVLAAAMAAGTFLTPAVSVLATFIMDDLGLSRSQLGLAPAGFATVAAVMSPAAGRHTDRIGGRTAVTVTFIFAALGLIGVALSRSVWTFVGAAAVAGVGQAFANPGTNKVLSLHLPVGERGLATGLKQSGVQLGLFLAGLTLPSIAILLGWRTAVAATSLAYLAWLLVVPRVIPGNEALPTSVHDDGTGAGPQVWWLAGYGLLMGAGGGALTVYLPLYAEEALRMSPQAAGLLAGMAGLTAFVSRITWSTVSERRRGPAGPLAVMAAVAAISTVLMLLAAEVGTGLLWVGALGHATSGLAWNSVGMLAVITLGGPRRSGQASGIVLLGFLAGFGLGPPVFGWSVDVTGTYRVGMISAAVAFGLALLATVTLRTNDR